MSMNNKEKLKEMLSLQDKLNTYILGEDWKQSEVTDWKRATWIECAELIDHIGYKWWKKQTLNLPQAQIECFDCLHFLMSQALVEGLDEEILIDSLDIQEFQDEDLDIKYLIEDLVFFLLDDSCDKDYHAVFFAICDKLSLTFDDLYFGYISKNVLNIFRQDHGYKEGTYIKEWPSLLEPEQVLEDNVFLEFAMAEAKEEKPNDLFNFIYNKLKIDYPG